MTETIRCPYSDKGFCTVEIANVCPYQRQNCYIPRQAFWIAKILIFTLKQFKDEEREK